MPKFQPLKTFSEIQKGACLNALVMRLVLATMSCHAQRTEQNFLSVECLEALSCTLFYFFYE